MHIILRIMFLKLFTKTSDRDRRQKSRSNIGEEYK